MSAKTGGARRFIYRANALAFAGTITRPDSAVLEAQASISLPSIGGRAAARVDGFRYPNLMSFGAASSVVIGSANGSIHNTVTTVIVDDLNIRGVVTADRVVAQLTSSQDIDGTNEIGILPRGSYFVNLRIEGFPIELKAETPLLECDTFLRLQKEWQKVGSRDGDSKDPNATEGRPLLSSLFATPDLSGTTLHAHGSSGCAIKVPGFGDVFLGEYLITPSSRHLTMVRVHMGSPVGGVMVCGDVGGNGSVYP
ncbi:MAG TPA: choice-of-anchor P family protein [Vicinamibacteria bacterium]|jgi:hypothetical protein|nr:choice-of-anchor P family protein [Vicinamibacteria bacterium]